MIGLKLILSRMNGWALSLVLHGGVALLAGLSVFSVQMGGGNGKGEGEGTGEGNAVGIYTPPPAYPGEARRRNIEGSVLVELAIASDGSCAVRRVLESSGFSPLDDAVQSTVQRWKYRPASADGRPEI